MDRSRFAVAPEPSGLGDGHRRVAEPGDRVGPL